MSENSFEFEGQQYYDDRLFVLYLCPGTVEIEEGDEGAVWTTVYHENLPLNHIWCVVTYRNCSGYPLYSVDSFNKKEDALVYLQKIEPETPLISLGGESPHEPLSYEVYLQWKKENNLKGYDWMSVYSVRGSNAQERIGQTKEQFKGIRTALNK